MHLDIFNNDAFRVSQLSLSMSQLPGVPGMLGGMGLFQEEGISTTTFTIEKQGSQLFLVPSAQRGAPARPVQGDKRSMLTFSTVHLPQRGAVLADEVQNLRAFGTESELETAQNLVNKKLAKMKRAIDATLEYHRVGAVKGQVLDADGTTVLLDVYSAFGVSQTSVNWALSNDATKVKQLCIDLSRTVEDELDGLTFTGIQVLCGRAFFDALVQHPAVTAAYDRWLSGEFLRTTQRGAEGFPFGDLVFKEFHGKVNGSFFVAADEAYAIPMGVPDLFIARFAPADYLETVNTLGLPYYAKQKPMDYDKGVEFESQSNPIHLCTRPKAIVKLVRT